MLQTVKSVCSFDDLIRDKWPSCSAPIVGTNPMVKPLLLFAEMICSSSIVEEITLVLIWFTKLKAPKLA